MRERLDDIRAKGAELVIVGNGSAYFASAFKEEFELDCPVLVDPELRAYRAAGLRRGRVEILSPRVALNALRAWAGGARQVSVQGDPWQLGGVFVVRAGGELVYRYVSSEAGDHPEPDEVVAAIDGETAAIAEDDESSALRYWLGRGLSLLADPTVALSFDRTGFNIHSLCFDPGDLDVDLSGRRCLVTGANSGLGFEIAASLAELGADVTMLCRNRERGEAAAETIREQSGNRKVEAVELDVSDLAAIRELAPRLAAGGVDVLIHNAGGLPDRRIESPQGLELTLATHVVGPFALTELLAPALEKSQDGRVIWMSSGGMYTQRLSLDDINWTERDYDGVSAYAQTKRAQVVLAELWARRFAGTSVTVNAMHPGWAETDGVRSSLPNFWRIMRPLLRSPAEGADTAVWLAASPAAAGISGQFFLDRQPRLTHYLPTTRESEAARDALWEYCLAQMRKS